MSWGDQPHVSEENGGQRLRKINMYICDKGAINDDGQWDYRIPVRITQVVRLKAVLLVVQKWAMWNCWWLNQSMTNGKHLGKIMLSVIQLYFILACLVNCFSSFLKQILSSLTLIAKNFLNYAHQVIKCNYVSRENSPALIIRTT